MKTRPWSIVVLAALQFLAPVVNILVSAQLSGAGLVTYLADSFQPQYFPGFVNITVPFFIAGYAIFRVRKWSYPVFLAVIGWTVLWNLGMYQDNPNRFPVSVLIASWVANAALVGFFLLPAVKAAYYNPRLRWWEQLPRYKVDLPAELSIDLKQVKGQVTDISEGGVFVKTSAKLEDEQRFEIKFSVMEASLNLTARVVYCRRGLNPGFGIQFLNLPREDKDQLARTVRALHMLGHRPTREQPNLWQDFLEWALTALKTGRGIVPTVPSVKPNAEKVVQFEPYLHSKNNDQDRKKSA